MILFQGIPPCSAVQISSVKQPTVLFLGDWDYVPPDEQASCLNDYPKWRSPRVRYNITGVQPDAVWLLSRSEKSLWIGEIGALRCSTFWVYQTPESCKRLIVSYCLSHAVWVGVYVSVLCDRQIPATLHRVTLQCHNLLQELNLVTVTFANASLTWTMLSVIWYSCGATSISVSNLCSWESSNFSTW